MSNSRLRLTPILLEAFFVVLGVSLALILSEWRQQAGHRERADHARDSIVEELQRNRELLRHSQDYHGMLLDSLTVLRETDGPPPYGLFRQGFMRPASIVSTAWDAAQAADAVSHMDYDEVLRFARLYSLQDTYHDQASMLGAELYSRMLDGGYPSIVQNYRNFADALYGFRGFERMLAWSYDELLDPEANAGRSPFGPATDRPSGNETSAQDG